MNEQGQGIGVRAAQRIIDLDRDLEQVRADFERMKRERDEALAAGRELAEAVEAYDSDGGIEAPGEYLREALARFREAIRSPD